MTIETPNSTVDKSDTVRFVFRASTSATKYCDKRIFYSYRLIMLMGQLVVGVEIGPRGTFTTRADALKAIRRRVRELKQHRLYAVQITDKHIKDGEARNCSTCAISQALWHNQERMGLSKYQYSFEVSPYACWIEPRGIVLTNRYEGEEVHLPADELPEIVMIGSRTKKLFTEDMVEWAQEFDDWGDARYMSLKDWREVRGYNDGERPYKPSPGWFVLDLDAFRANREQE